MRVQYLGSCFIAPVLFMFLNSFQMWESTCNKRQILQSVGTKSLFRVLYSTFWTLPNIAYMSDPGPGTWRATTSTVHCPPLNPLDSGGCWEGVYIWVPGAGATIQPILFTDKFLAMLNWNSWHLRPATASPDTADNQRKLPDTDNVCSHLTDHWKYL